jgi:3-hydroxybutyryl-CoA dehydratase
MSGRSGGFGTPFSAMTEAWTTVASSVLKTAAAANTATAAAMTDDGDDDERVPGFVPSVAYDETDWTFERTVSDPDELGVGDEVRFSKTLETEDVERFAGVSGDTNRLHLDDEFAAETRFGGRIAHGTLVSGTISAALARLPGLTIYLSQELEFRGPVEIGDRVTAVVEVVEALGGDQFRLSTHVESDDEVVVDGEATVLVDDLPED